MARGSTTALGPVVLSKPGIMQNLSEDPDRVGAQEGEAVGVHRARHWITSLKRLPIEEGGLARKRKRYIGKYLYRVVGKATERVLNHVDEMTGRSADKP